MTSRFRTLSLAALVVACGSASAQPGGQWKGEGALVTRDGAPGYEEKSGTAVKRTFQRGDAVAGFHKEFLATVYEFFEEDGRVRVLYPKPDSALMADAWMDPADLLNFVYDCCDAECIPVKASFKRAEWNPCFNEGIRRARASLPPAGHEAAAPQRGAREPAAAASGSPGEKALTNEDVVAMVKADLGDDLVISKIRQAPRETLDVSSDALVKLKKQGVSKAVLDAMLRRASAR
jgi:hypothetical protein